MEDSTTAENGACEPPMENSNYTVEKLREMLDSASTDFDALVSLIREVEHSLPNDIGAINLIYDKFLAEFPLCYAFWVKYGAHKSRLCVPNEVVQIYERAVHAVTFSVDLWCNYCTFGTITFENPSDVRRLFERALSFVGKDYLCHQIWDKYIEFEHSHKQWHRLANIYINILKFPTKKLHAYYQSFKKLATLLEEEASIQGIQLAPVSVPNQNGEGVRDFEISDISSVIQDFTDANSHKVDIDAIKKYLWVGEELYRKSCEIEKNIICYEENITRHSFNVKPLDGSQLDNWHRYLDFVETQGDFDWMVKLYERCLIPCAYYPEFWIRYIEFVDAHGGREISNYALGRSPPFFHKKVPSYRMYCAMVEEETGDLLSARSLLLHDISSFPSNHIKDVYREANLEKRMGNIEGAFKLYENEIEATVEKKNVEAASNLYINFAQFTFVVTSSRDAAREVFVKGIKQIPSKSIIKGLIQFEIFHGGASQIPTLESIISNVIEPQADGSAPLCYEEREEISMLFFDFVDLCGKTREVRKAWARHCVLFPIKLRNVFPLTNSATNKRAKLEKSTKENSDTESTEKSLDQNPLNSDNEILHLNSDPMVEIESEDRVKEGGKSLEECSVGATQTPESKTDPIDPVKANSEPETVEQKPDGSSQVTKLTVSPEASEMDLGQALPISGPGPVRPASPTRGEHSNKSEMQTDRDVAVSTPNLAGFNKPVSGPSPVRPASPTRGERSKSEMESGRDLAVSNPNLAGFNKPVTGPSPVRPASPTPQPPGISQHQMVSSQPYQTLPAGVTPQSLNAGVQSGQVGPPQMWQYNQQQQLQQMYYHLQLQQQQLQQNQLQHPSLSSPNNSLQEEKQRQQLQQQTMYYQQTYQVYLQQVMHVQQQQQQWYQYQQQQMALANAPSSQQQMMSVQFANSQQQQQRSQEMEIPQDKEQSGSSHPSTPNK